MARAHRPILENYVSSMLAELEIVKARIVSQEGQAPFEVWTHVGFPKFEGEGEKVHGKYVDFMSKRRVAIPLGGFSVQHCSHELFGYTRDSRFVAHVITHPDSQTVRVCETHTGMGVFSWAVPAAERIIIEKKHNAFLKFSNSGKKIAFLMTPKEKFDPQLTIINIEDVTDMWRMPYALEMNIVVFCWAPDDQSIVFVHRFYDVNGDNILFLHLTCPLPRMIGRYQQHVEHLEFSPHGDQLIFFLASGQGIHRDLPFQMVIQDWPGFGNGAIFNMKSSELLSVPERAWSKNGNLMVFNTVSLSSSNIMIYSKEKSALNMFLNDNLYTAVAHDYYDNELLFEYTPDYEHSRRHLYLHPLTEEYWDVDMYKDEELVEVRNFQPPNGSLYVDTRIMYYELDDNTDKSSGFVLFPTLERQLITHKYPLIVIPHTGDGSVPLPFAPSTTIRLMLSLGYAVFQVNYKYSTVGYGTCRSLPSERHYGDSEDAFDAVEDLFDKSEEGGLIDRNRIFLYGHKYGSFVAARMLMKDQRYKAAVLVEPTLHFTCDCRMHQRKEMLQAKPHELNMTNSRQIKAPVMIISDKEKAEIPNLREMMIGLKKNKLQREFLKKSLSTELYVIDALEWFEKFDPLPVTPVPEAPEVPEADDETEEAEKEKEEEKEKENDHRNQNEDQNENIPENAPKAKTDEN